MIEIDIPMFEALDRSLDDVEPLDDRKLHWVDAQRFPLPVAVYRREGIAVTAACGYTWVPQGEARRGDGYEVCAACDRIAYGREQREP